MDKNIEAAPAVRTVIGEGVVIHSQFSINQQQLNDLSVLIYEEVDKKKSEINTKIKGLSETAQMLVTHSMEEWNGETRASLLEKLNAFFKESDELLLWEVTKNYSDTNKHGNSYSAMRLIGVKAKNKAIEHTLYSYN